MTPDWTHSVDVDRLADMRAAHEFAYPLAELPRLRDHLLRAEGLATGRASFARERGLVLASLEVTAQLSLQCQRCMQAVSIPVRSESRVALVDDLVDADALPEDVEQFLANNGRVLLRDVIEEELLLGLPLVARHDDVRCAEASAVQAETTQTPFAELGELLKRR